MLQTVYAIQADVAVDLVEETVDSQQLATTSKTRYTLNKEKNIW